MIAMVFLLAALTISATARELTFEMEAHSTQCFFEIIALHEKVTVEHEVVYGGHRDVDVLIQLGDKKLYTEQRSSSSANTFTADQAGELQVCFSNEFSTVAHKTVYLDLIVGNRDDPLAAKAEQHRQTFTQLETSVASVHDSLRKVIDFQTHHRVRETTHRYTAEAMNERVQFVSAYETLLLIVISVFQVLYLRSLFTDKADHF